MFRAIQEVDPAEVEEKISSGVDVNAPDNNQAMPLQLAVNRALERENSKRADSVKIVMLLLAANARINNDQQETLLHQLCAREDYLERIFHRLTPDPGIETARLEILQTVLASNPPLEQRGSDGNAPLMIALQHYNHAAARLLYKAGANVSVCDDQGTTAMHLVCQMDDVEMVRLFIDRGATVHAKNKKGLFPLDQAHHPGIILLLLKLQAESSTKDLIDFFKIAQESQHHELMDYLFGIGLATFLGRNGLTALHVVTDAMLARRLLDAGADLDAVETLNNHTPLLQIVAGSRLQQNVDELLAILNLFIGEGADVNKQDCHNNTILHLIISIYYFYNNIELIRVILKTKIEKNAQNIGLQTALSFSH